MEAILVNLVDRIENYWSKRSDDFFDLRIEELKSDKRQLWQDEIIANLPDKEHLKILDVGCGPGFFSVILSSLGHDVIGIDLTESMIQKADEIADILDYDIDFRVMNAQELDFGDEEFDVVISRNLTWTLPDIEKAYKEVCKNTRNERKVFNMKQYKAIYISRIYEILKNREYKVGPYNRFVVYEPKERQIVSQGIQDKVINHLVARYILYPAILPCLIETNVASRIYKGTSAGIRYEKEFIKKCNIKYNKYYILKCDVSKFFASINHDILKEKLEKKLNLEYCYSLT